MIPVEGAFTWHPRFLTVGTRTDPLFKGRPVKNLPVLGMQKQRYLKPTSPLNVL